ncbi:MAG: hypothetical protein AAB535_01580 [Patescibacteria group bacterium]
MEYSWEDNFSFWKSLFFVAVFFTIAPITIGVSLFSLISLKYIPKGSVVNTSGVRIYASLPNSFPSINGSVEATDARVEIIRQYLTNYKSSLEPHASFIVQTSDKYGLDYRLITAIAQQESNLCKLIPPSSFNCWGWGIHSEGTLGFGSFEQGIEVVSKGLKEQYLDKGYVSPEQIMSKYTPLSNGSWASGVNQFMNEME